MENNTFEGEEELDITDNAVNELMKKMKPDVVNKIQPFKAKIMDNLI